MFQEIKTLINERFCVMKIINGLCNYLLRMKNVFVIRNIHKKFEKTALATLVRSYQNGGPHVHVLLAEVKVLNLVSVIHIF